MNPRFRSKGYDFAGDLQAKDICHAGRRRIMALALMDIRSVDACGFHTDQDLAICRDRTRAHLDLERLGTARTGRDNRAHALV